MSLDNTYHAPMRAIVAKTFSQHASYRRTCASQQGPLHDRLCHDESTQGTVWHRQSHRDGPVHPRWPALYLHGQGHGTLECHCEQTTPPCRVSLKTWIRTWGRPTTCRGSHGEHPVDLQKRRCTVLSFPQSTAVVFLGQCGAWAPSY